MDKELSTADAAAALSLTQQSIRQHIKAGRLPAVRRGVRGVFWIREIDLLVFAKRYNYPVNHSALDLQA